MAVRRHYKRVLVYSHDSFGLGHLRRCRAIAHSLVDSDPAVSVLILSGSPIIGSFDFRSRVDFVRVPGVIKLRNGEYVSLNLHIDIEETLAMRSSIIRHTADIFDPDLLIVDKEPLGLRGEVRDTLDLLRRRGTALILGLRDVMDDPEALESEWERKQAVPALAEYYDEVWVYGLPQICDPLAGLLGSEERARAYGLYWLPSSQRRSTASYPRNSRDSRERIRAGHARWGRRRGSVNPFGSLSIRVRSCASATCFARLRPLHAS